MTMPTLMAKYQEHVLRNQAKKVYAVLNTAYQNTLYDYGISGFDQYKYTNDEKIAFTKSFLDKLSVAQKYENVPLLQNGVIPNYTPISTAMQNPDDSTLENWTKDHGTEGEEFDLSSFMNTSFGGYNNFSRLKYAYVLNDGSIIMFYPYSNFISVNNFLVDVNGKKGPNRWGYDLFMGSASNKRPSVGFYNISEKGGIGVRSINGI